MSTFGERVAIINAVGDSIKGMGSWEAIDIEKSHF